MTFSELSCDLYLTSYLPTDVLIDVFLILDASVYIVKVIYLDKFLIYFLFSFYYSSLENKIILFLFNLRLSIQFVINLLSMTF